MCKSYEGNYAKAEPSPNPGPAHGRVLAKPWPSLAQSLVRPWLGPRQGFARPRASNKRTGMETGEKGVFPNQSLANLEIRFGARLGPGLCKIKKLIAFQRGPDYRLPPRHAKRMATTLRAGLSRKSGAHLTSGSPTQNSRAMSVVLAVPARCLRRRKRVKASQWGGRPRHP